VAVILGEEGVSWSDAVGRPDGGAAAVRAGKEY